MKNLLIFFSLLTLSLLLTGCGKKDEQQSSVEAMSFQEFVPIYNSYIDKWLAGEVATLQEKLKEVEGEEKEQIIRDIKKLEFRQSLDGYFSLSSEEELPAGLEWEDGMEHPEIGDPRAKKGGVLRTRYVNFPPTLRAFGPESNNFWRGILYENVEMGLISLHPENGAVIPAVADKWAVTNEGRTVVFHIDQKARFDDGVKISSLDFLCNVFYRISDYVHNPYSKQYFREQFAQIKSYGEEYVAITLPSAKPLLPYFCNLTPAPRHFYKDYGPDYEQRYQWKYVPTAGAYTVKPSGIVKGVSITQTRVKDWWAKDKKYYKYRYNPDAVRTTSIKDDSKAFELLRAGQLDYMLTTKPETWYEKTEIPEVFNGYIEKSEFYNIYPRRPLGIYLNTHKPQLSDVNFRIGVHHALNWQKIINTVYRGDFARLQQFSDGWSRYTEKSVKAREYSVEKARAAFRKAGYTAEDENGFLINSEGQKASMEVTFGNSPEMLKFMPILKIEAKAAGLNLVLDPLESGVWRKKLDEKSYEGCIVIFGVTPPFPQYYQMVHSSNAYDAEGNPKRGTNNLYNIADKKLDELSLNMRFAKTEEELEKNAKEAQIRMWELALFVPAFTTDFLRVSSWRWVCWPDSETTQFLPAMTYEPRDVFVSWIDEEKKKETLEAKRTGKSFPEVVNIYDKHRKKGGNE